MRLFPGIGFRDRPRRASVIGTGLGKGHDVLALAGDASYDKLADEDVLALSTAGRRILVTHNVDDFAIILRDRVGGGRSDTAAECLVDRTPNASPDASSASARPPASAGYSPIAFKSTRLRRLPSNSA
jgi:hypothetical protein